MITGSVLLLALLLFVAVRAPKWEAVTAVLAAGVVLALGLVAPHVALARCVELAPTLGFLAAILVVARQADTEGVFAWVGTRAASARWARGRGALASTFVLAALTTAVLSLDATVVLLTPVLVHSLRITGRPRTPHVYATLHLANSASVLMPVSNLTNLLVFPLTGLSFLAFTAAMAPAWLAVIAVEFVVFTVFFRTSSSRERVVHTPPAVVTPVFALVVLAVMLVGFGLTSLLSVAPVWVATAAAIVLVARGLLRRRTTVRAVFSYASPGFLVFVFGLAVVVQALAQHGLTDALARLIPDGTSWPALLALAAIAAVMACVVNNLPATLVLGTALGPHAAPALILAMLLGVNIGPNLTYTGSLATLLWRRILATLGIRTDLREFSVLGLATVPACLIAGVTAVWLTV